MLDTAIRSLQASAEAIYALTRPLTPDERNWRPTPDAWSIHDVVCHLLDEEREDFRLRLRLLLEDPAQPWPPIDPEGWPKTRGYASRNYGEALASWEEERRQSLLWLRSLDSSALALDQSRTMPWGELRAGDLLAAWVAHDLLHLRQITSRRFRQLDGMVEPYVTRYAGEW